MSDDQEDARSQRLNAILAAYLQSVEAGRPPNRDQLLAQHPELAAELRAFLAQHEAFQGLAVGRDEATLVPAAVVQEATLPPGDSGAETLQLGAKVRYFGDYELLEEIARGGMGVVYKARQVSLNRIVALKMILAGQLASEEDVRRFHAEAEAAANLDHPGIVPIYEVGEHAGHHYFSMGYVEGQSLADKLQAGPLPPREAAEYTYKVAEAIAFAHQWGVIHRDLKPGNVLLDRRGAPKVTDFGLAKRVQDDRGLTATGQVLGTPSYMPPEQAAGKVSEIKEPADIYALGAILYALVTGRPPFQSDNPLDTLLQVLEREPVAPRELNPKVPQDLETICLKCLEKDSRRRYRSAGELADELQRFLNGEPVLARPVGRTERLWRWCRRNPVIAGLEVGLFLVFLLGFCGVAWQWHRAEVRGREALGLLAEQYLNNGLSQCNQGEVARGMVWLARGLEIAPTDRSGHHRFRANLGYWSQKINQLRGMLDYPGPVGSVAFSPDGRTIATVCQVKSWNEKIIAGQTFQTVEETAGEVRLCDADTLRPIGQPLIHEGPVTAVAFSPDGKTLFTANGWGTDPQSPDPTVARLWDLETGKVLWRIPGRTHHTISAASFSPDGKSVVTGGRGGTPQIWDAATGKLLVGSGNHQGGITALAFSPDSGKVLAGGDDGTPRLMDTATGKLIAQPAREQGQVQAAVFTPDGKIVVTAGESTALRWDAATLKPIGEPIPPPDAESRVERIVLSPDGRTILTNSGNTLQFWDTAKGNRIGSPLQHPDRIRTAAYGSDGRMAVTATTDGTVRIWDAAIGRPQGEPIQHEDWDRSVAISPDGQTVAILGDNGRSVRVWDPTLDRQIGQPLEASDGTRVVFSLDGTKLLVTSQYHDYPHGVQKNRANLWEVVKSRIARRGPQLVGLPISVAFSPDGQFILTGVSNPNTRLGSVVSWDARSGKQLREFFQGPEGSGTVLVSPDGRTVLANSGRAVRLWHASTGRSIGKPIEHRYQFQGKVGELVPPDSEGPPQPGQYYTDAIMVAAFSPDSKTIVTGGGFYDRTARLWDVSTGEPIGQPMRHQGQVVAVAFSPDGRTIVTGGGRDGTAQRWNLATQNPMGPPLQHQGPVWSVAFSPDGTRVVTGSVDNTARLWHVTTGRPIGAPLQHQNQVRWVAFSPDSSRVVTGSVDETRLWDAATGQPIGQLIEHQIPVLPVFSSDGTTIVTQGPDATQFWDSFTGEPIGQPVEGRAFLSPDGKTILTLAKDGTSWFSEVPAAVEGAAARIRLWVEVVTLLELDKTGLVRGLDAESWQERRQQLDNLGGPPLPSGD